MKQFVVLLLTVIICAAVKRVYSIERDQVVLFEDLKANWKGNRMDNLVVLRIQIPCMVLDLINLNKK